MKVDWSGVEVHLAPGGIDSPAETARWLEPDQIEPLFHDTMLLARALDGVARGQTPNLPQG